ncbi:nucleotidyltransferase domain-containing protein [Paenibacillus sp. JX-17]|uniref:Nucleotidyltransferase domain-containing protein n=1 Tax=Paenibacillus lacisoli TaxID=3064525 RepID=A0ABT9CED5_9BACL|nr:nucleotidyltransferase domain-containing protein [Paenibacillus sp. JX-17]MDO7907637.1 nucleotidyltransferase domain-containing protein [Paenibacillus sp. JX-17]
MSRSETQMLQLIHQELERIEQQEQVRILYACESGSRAWGFASPESDYDVRFIYIRPVEWYLQLEEGKDVIERPISDRLDLNGWDLRKALRLFRKSNPPLLEWLESPMKYLEQYSVAGAIRSLSSLSFSPQSCIYHYLNMAKGNYRDYLQRDEVRVKKYLYVLRPLLACAWIEKFSSMPPLQFDQLIDELLPPGQEITLQVRNLVERKKAGEELSRGARLPLLNRYMEEQMDHFDRTAAGLQRSRERLDDRLGELFRSALLEVWGVWGT